MQITLNSNYGSLPKGLNFSLPKGYVVIIGENNLGKTSLLQHIFKAICKGDSQLIDKICFIPKHRDFISFSTSPGGDTLAKFNQGLFDKLNSNPLNYGNATEFRFEPLFTALINYRGFYKQLGSVRQCLKSDGFGEYDTAQNQIQVLDGIELPRHGSGVRGLMPIYAAIKDPGIQYIIIDEPEASLEANKQKLLKTHLLNACKNSGKNIVIATHSHLFLNEENTENNLILKRTENGLKIEPLKEKVQFRDIAFKMLGNSFSDLYLPDNFLFVEGASDQIIAEKVLQLMEIGNFDLRIISCGGLQEVKPTMVAMKHNLRTIMEGKSPYSKLIVALVDTPNKNDVDKNKRIDELKKHLEKDGRFFQISQETLEEYLDESFYEKAGLSKTDKIAEIKAAKGNYAYESKIKREISSLIAEKLEDSDLPKLQTIVDAINKAKG